MVAKGIRTPRDVGEAMDAIKKLPSYARLVWSLARDDRVPKRQKLLLGAIAAYLAMPIDLIPDFIPVIGQLDDLAVLIFGLDLFIKVAPKEVVDEHIARIAKDDDQLLEDLGRVEKLFSRRASDLRATLERILARDDQGGKQ
jgi:uncharacterized membrane protein YkvA (DUF1232 family)